MKEMNRLETLAKGFEREVEEVRESFDLIE